MTIVYVGELMTEKLEKVSILSSAQEASTKMSDNNISSLVVFDKDNHKPIGIVTERDLVRKVCVSGIGSGDISIRDVMSPSPLVTIDSRSSIEAAAHMMIQNKVRHLIVMNHNDRSKVVGIITPTDFVGFLKENLIPYDELNAKLLQLLRDPRGEDIVYKLEEGGKLEKDSQKGGRKYEDENQDEGGK